jgi:hypothetical protein
MAKDQTPTAKERRRQLAQPKADMGPAGRHFLAQGRWGEALECLAAAKDQAGLQDLAAQALEMGDLFYFRRAQEALGQPLATADLESLARRARETGKEVFLRGAKSILEPTPASES